MESFTQKKKKKKKKITLLFPVSEFPHDIGKHYVIIFSTYSPATTFLEQYLYLTYIQNSTILQKCNSLKNSIK